MLASMSFTECVSPTSFDANTDIKTRLRASVNKDQKEAFDSIVEDKIMSEDLSKKFIEDFTIKAREFNKKINDTDIVKVGKYVLSFANYLYKSNRYCKQTSNHMICQLTKNMCKNPNSLELSLMSVIITVVV